MKHAADDPAFVPSAPVEVVVETGWRTPLLAGALLMALGVALGSGLRAPLAPVAALAPQPAPAAPEPSPAPVATPAPEAPPARPVLEVVFVVDATGSMGGILRAAREKVWTIADALLARPGTPALAFGLVSYRDQGDEYVARVDQAPSLDLDGFYAALSGLRAQGGGDEPEAVDAALEAALGPLSWSWLSHDPLPGTARAIVLVGDAPPHAQRLARTLELVGEARARGVAVHTVYCGEDEPTAALFARLAVLGGGVPARLELQPRVVALSTPHDEALARLQRELEATALPFGAPGQQAALQSKQAANERLGAEAWAARASVNCKSGAGYSEDLLQALEDGRLKLTSWEPSQTELAAPLRGLELAALRADLQVRLDTRRTLRALIAAEVAARDAWLRDSGRLSQDPLTRTIVRALLRQLGVAEGC